MDLFYKSKRVYYGINKHYIFEVTLTLIFFDEKAFAPFAASLIFNS